MGNRRFGTMKMTRILTGYPTSYQLVGYGVWGMGYGEGVSTSTTPGNWFQAQDGSTWTARMPLRFRNPEMLYLNSMLSPHQPPSLTSRLNWLYLFRIIGGL